jgi:hypothetical protein
MFIRKNIKIVIFVCIIAMSKVMMGMIVEGKEKSDPGKENASAPVNISNIASKKFEIKKLYQITGGVIVGTAVLRLLGSFQKSDSVKNFFVTMASNIKETTAADLQKSFIYALCCSGLFYQGLSCWDYPVGTHHSEKDLNTLNFDGFLEAIEFLKLEVNNSKEIINNSKSLLEKKIASKNAVVLIKKENTEALEKQTNALNVLEQKEADITRLSSSIKESLESKFKSAITAENNKFQESLTKIVEEISAKGVDCLPEIHKQLSEKNNK